MITHVAIRFEGVVYSLPAPNRHHDVIRKIVEETGVKFVYKNPDTDDAQGFLDDTGRFLNRKQALIHAIVNDQVKDLNKVRLDMLFSEDLW